MTRRLYRTREVVSLLMFCVADVIETASILLHPETERREPYPAFLANAELDGHDAVRPAEPRD